ncbi:MAG: metallophosphoesterase family protein, partial [Clostridiales Family XIII bacterium]|nr:metallophosphoesterase family protein [Clostridiales Family XIII bacterium]
MKAQVAGKPMKISQRSKSDRVRLRWLTPILIALALGLVLSGCSVKSGGALGGGDADAPSGIIMSLTDSAPGAEYRTRTISWRMPAQVKESALYYEEVTEGAAKAKEPSPRLIPGALVPETDESATDYGQYSHFEAEMTDLHAGEYTYRVGTEENLSDPVTFRVGDPDEPQTAFLFFGDVQPDGGLDDYKVFSSILAAAYKEHPDAAFGLQVGDIGNVGNAGEEWTEFLNRAQPVFDKIPLMTAVGNHEITPYVTRFAGKPLRYLDAFALPKNGPYGYEEEFYSFDYGQVHVLVLSSNYQ